MANGPPTHDSYIVGWVCALSKEQTVAIAMLDELHDPLPKPPHDLNVYTLGSIGPLNVVIACLPKGKVRTSSAAAVATQMINTFTAIRFSLMVGIGSGVSTKVRLGDVVVGMPAGQYPGVVQWNMDKTEQGGKFMRTGALNNPPSILLAAVEELESMEALEGSKIPEGLETLRRRHPEVGPKYLRPGHLQDNLFQASYKHVSKTNGSANLTVDENGDNNDEVSNEDEDGCHGCDIAQTTKPQEAMMVHHGTIASGNQVIENSGFRDQLSKDLGGILCVEMEVAGLPNSFPCIVIRGISDYADSHKNKAWEEYAAAVAAAHAKALLGYVQPAEVARERTVQEQMIEIERGIRQVQQCLHNKGDRKILDWITPLDYTLQHSDYLQRRQEGTGQWFLGSNEYQEWLENAQSIMLCLGPPGSGKTILASMAIDDLQKRFNVDESVGIAYIYCDYRRQECQTVTNLVSCIAKQLGGSRRSLPECLRSIHENHSRKKTRPSLSEMSNALQSLVEPYRKIYIVIDALDEWQATNGCRVGSLSQIFDLQPQKKIKLFVTCRNIPDIVARFPKGTCLRIRASMDDLRTYLEGHMERIPSFLQRDSALKKKIVTTIMEAADGIFLLAQIYLESLVGKKTKKAMQNGLSRMRKHHRRGQTSEHSGNDEFIAKAYDQIMDRVDKQTQQPKDTAVRVLSWITATKRPLRTIELQHAFAVNTVIRSPTADKDNIPDIEYLVSVCCGLVTVDKRSEIIRLAHYTIQEYFEREPREWFLKAQAEIARTCTRYLSFETFKDGHVQQRDDLEFRLRSNPLYSYAATYWGRHARHNPQCPSVQHFLRKQKAVQASFQVLWDLKRDQLGLNSADLLECLPFPENMTGLHLAAYFGLTKAVKGILDANDINSLDGAERRTPLWWAAAQGNHDVVKLLIDSGADFEARDVWGCTPLWHAASKGHRDVVQLLLKRGANTDDVAKVLIKSKAVVSRSSLNSLFTASEPGFEHVVEALVKTGADIEALGDDGRTPLWSASEMGHRGLVELLVSSGAEIEAVGDKGATPLGIASELGHEDVVEFLVQRGANTEARNQDDCTPLFMASRYGHKGVVEILLQAGANAEATEKWLGWDPLKAAEDISKKEEVVEILRRHCAG